MSEKAITIGWYAVASGISVWFGDPMPILGAPGLTQFATQDVNKMVGAHWAFEADPILCARQVIEHLNAKREALKLKPMMYEAVDQAAG